MYRCLDCGHEFDTPVSWEESRGEFWGIPCAETMYGCPYCKGDFEESEDDDECL